MPVKIRPIAHSDLQTCSQLYASVFSAAPWSEPWTEQAAFQRLRHFFQSAGFVGMLAETDQLLGMALGNTEPYCSHGIFYLREMCTRDDLQSQGIGTQVLNALEQDLASQGVRSIYLLTNRQIPAANFYARQGFTCGAAMGFYVKNLERQRFAE